MIEFPSKAGWYIKSEDWPSLNKHFLPINGGHQLSNRCWCKPDLQGEPLLNPPYTMVLHNGESN